MQHKMDILNTSSFCKNFRSIWFRLKKQNIKRSENKSADSIVCTDNLATECSENLANTFFANSFWKKACQGAPFLTRLYSYVYFKVLNN